MFRPFKEQFQLANDGASDGESELVWIKGVAEKTVQVVGTFEADVVIEARLDPLLPFADTGLTFTAPGLAQVVGTYDQIRVVVDNYVSGDITVYITGQQAMQG